jgi:hypothetical protein
MMDYSFLWVLVFIVVAVLFIIVKTKTSSSHSDEDFPYHQIGHLFTPAERSFYGVLCQACEGKVIVFGKVRVADVLKTESGLSNSVRQIAFNRISGKHFDYVLCNPEDLSIIATVELDDSSHNSKKAIKRDEFLESACRAADLTLHRFKASYNYKVSEVRDVIFPAGAPLDKLEAEAYQPAVMNEEIKEMILEVKAISSTACPKCSSDLVIRTVKKGEKKGSNFLACSAFPKCRYTLYDSDVIETR